MQLPILYSYRRCPYAMRARMALRYAGIKVEIREIVLKSKPEHMLAVSPKGTVPVLVLSDGQVIDESLDIMAWALAQNDPDGWLVSDALYASLIAENDGRFKCALDQYKYAIRCDAQPAQIYRQQGEVFLVKLEVFLTRQAYLAGDKMTQTDVAIFPFVRQFSMVDAVWFSSAPLPRLQQWLAGLIDSPLFKAVMEKQSSWRENAQLYN
jgi:glutathione S-transferase